MKISYNWLKELLPDLTATPEEVAEALTMHAYETEVVNRWEIDDRVKIVKVEKLEPHPNADRLQLATVTDGKNTIRIVCGSPNIEIGQVVPYSPPGTKVIGEDGQPFKIKEAEIRGEKSPGMINSARELGLSDNHSGNFVVPADTPLGSKLTDHFPNDVILETDITPNRAHDSLSHLGVARELAGLLQIKVVEPEVKQLPKAKKEVSGFSLNIEATSETPRYMGVIIDDVKNESSPLWMQARLIAMDAKPISALVDVTNYVQFELGNPSHVFDTARLPGKIIGVRKGTNKEELTTLDNEKIRPGEQDLVITSDDKPVALAGVIGGLPTGVDEETSSAFLEIANFHGYPIQETSRRHNIRTESSHRFSKGIDPNLAEHAAKRLVQLISDISKGEVQGILDHYPTPRVKKAIQFRPERISAITSTEVDYDEIKSALIQAQCEVDDSNEVWNVTAPTNRLDIKGEHDIAEEVVRIIGLENIPSQQVKTKDVQVKPLPAKVYWREAVRDRLVDWGFTEVMNDSFEPAGYARALQLDKKKHITIANPMAPELANMRVSLLPGLLKNVATNRDDFHKKFSKQERALFEIGNVYIPSNQGTVPGVQEQIYVAGVLVGDKAMARNTVQEIRKLLDIEINEPTYLDALPRAVMRKVKYRVPLAAFELNLTEMITHASSDPIFKQPTLADIKKRDVTGTQYQEFSRYPSVLRDISFLVDEGVTIEQAQELIERVGGELVVDTDLFDEYDGKSFESPGSEDMEKAKENMRNRKALGFHIEYQSKNSTLTDKEVNKVHAKIIEALESQLLAKIR